MHARSYIGRMADTHDDTEPAQGSPADRMAQPWRSRMNLWVRPRTRELIDALQADMEAASASEVVRRSVSITRVLIDAQRAGGRILIERPGDVVERVEVMV